MIFRLHFIFLFSLIIFQTSEAQEKKKLTINRTEKTPKIDGVLDDVVWQNATIATDFIQFRPEMGVLLQPHQKTIVKMAYDDKAIYLAAYLKDDPKDIQIQNTSRDNFGNSDFFGLILNPNNDAQNDTEFFVFSSGTQADAVATPDNGEDFGWNAVWDSAVKLVNDGWIIEMKIPYRALRFSNDKVQTWGIQFHRRFRLNNSQYSWNPIDRTKGNIGLYHGELTGIKDIEPPTRLSFYPFASSVVRLYEGKTTDEYNLGLDVKYGITENLTLDATLIPDFSQAAFDNLRLNLGPFEQTFSEQRQFFKEGVDLFNKGNLFFSRRIGNAPSGDVDLDDNEETINFPNEVKVLNALKVSGRTKKGLGIGFFNAITEKTEATIRKTEEVFNPITNLTETIITDRKQVVEPLANYNILVIDQQFNKNSSVSFVNTNVLRSGQFRDANVTGLLFDISDKANKFNYSGDAKMSNINQIDGTVTGYSTRLRFAKISGKYQYYIGHQFADRQYEINDLGLQSRNNFNNLFGNVSYRIFEPTKRLNNFSLFTWWDYNRLYDPSTYTGNSVGISMSAQNKKLMWFGGNINGQIGKQYDYFEPRDLDNNRFFVYKNQFNTNAWLETNSNKTFSVETNLGMATQFDSERDLFFYWFGFEPTILFNDKFRVSYNYFYENGKGSRGFVNTIDDDIIFGERDQLTIENSISGSYNFNPYHTLALTFRNFWATVTYDNDLYVLEDDGSLSQNAGITTADVDDPNINFNTWNLDLSYSWQIAPGSFLTTLYRNQLFNSTTNSEDNYFESLGHLFDKSLENTFSLRLTYFIDYNNIKTIFSKKKSNIDKNMIK